MTLVERYGADPAAERLWTPATVITFVRTIASLAVAALAVVRRDEHLLWAALGIYWVGDILDGAVARKLGCETRIGAVLDILCDRVNCAPVYLGLAWLHHDFVVPIFIYLFQFMTIDAFLSIAFLVWWVRSPNYFFEVDRTIFTWNWSKPAKAVNSAAVVVLMLLTGSMWVGLVIALALVVLKVVSLRRLLAIGLPIPPFTGAAHSAPETGTTGTNGAAGTSDR